MAASSANSFSNFTFEFRRFHLDTLFSIEDRNRMLNWIAQARHLLIKIILKENLEILHIWLNIYDGVYDTLTTTMSTSMCMHHLRTLPAKYAHEDGCAILSNLISSFDISVPYPTSLQSPTNPKYRLTGLAERVFDFNHDCAAAKMVDKTPTILLNHMMFDVNREKQDSNDIITESNGILFIAIVLAHEITHAINLARSIGDVNTKKKTPTLLLFRSYSHGGDIDGGDMIERLLLDGEMHLSKPPPSPPILYLIVASDGKQVRLTTKAVEECVNKCTLTPISQLINLTQPDSNQPLKGSGARKGSADESPQFQPLLTYPTLDTETEHLQPSSPTIPRLQSMMHAL